MASIKGKNTKPELYIRRILWSNGKRYRIHDRSVFGTPDISNKRRKLAVFIDGCFWHGCGRCYKEPHTNTEYWKNKIANNKKRRHLVTKYLKSDKWTVLEFWEHQVNNDHDAVVNKIIEYMK